MKVETYRRRRLTRGWLLGGRLLLDWYGRRWTYVHAAHCDSLSQSLGYSRFAWLAIGPVDLRWFY